MGGRVPLGEGEAWALLRRAEVVHVAGPGPRLRTLHPALRGGALWFHGGRGGDKDALVGAPVVAQATEVVARIPSWMRHPERACPATTWYRSVQVQGVLREVHDPVQKAAALQALMEARQPEGRHARITADDPRYTKALRTTRVLVLRPDAVRGVAKLGQTLSGRAMARVLGALWQRGAPGDLAAIEVLRAAHPARPGFAAVPDGLVPRCHPTPADADAAAALVVDQYWNGPFDAAQLAAATLASDAWVGLERDGVLVGTARGISDRVKRAWIYDVAVHPDHRGQGLGTVLLELLLAHPAMQTATAHLGTRDAMAFYARLGFAAVQPDPAEPRTLMVRARS